MADYWIVSSQRFHRHDTLAQAEAERDRLTAKMPQKFRVYRVKDNVNGGQSFNSLCELLIRARDFIENPDAAARPLLLDEISNKLVEVKYKP